MDVTHGQSSFLLEEIMHNDALDAWDTYFVNIILTIMLTSF